MRNFQLTLGLLAVFAVTLASNSADAQLIVSSQLATPNAVTLVYDPADGNVSVNHGGGQLITTFELIAPEGAPKFNPANITPGLILPPFDVATADKIFKLDTAGNGGYNFGTIAPTGLTAEAIAANWQLNGSLAPSGSFGQAAGGGPYIYAVPEPASVALLGLGALGLMGIRRKRS